MNLFLEDVYPVYDFFKLKKEEYWANINDGDFPPKPPGLHPIWRTILKEPVKREMTHNNAVCNKGNIVFHAVMWPQLF